MRENACNTVLAEEPLLYHPMISVVVVAGGILKSESLIGGKAVKTGLTPNWSLPRWMNPSSSSLAATASATYCLSCSGDICARSAGDG